MPEIKALILTFLYLIGFLKCTVLIQPVSDFDVGMIMYSDLFELVHF